MAKINTAKKARPKAASIPSKGKITAKRVFFFTLSLGAVGGAIYLAREYYLQRKAGDTTADGAENIKSHSSTNNIYNIFSSGGDSFPLKRGSKGDRVSQLQKALVTLLGNDVGSQNGGIDGSFGKGTESLLKLAGYGKSVDQALFNQIVNNEPTILFNPQDLADKLYHSASSKDSATVIKILRQIKDTSQYSAVNDAYKKIGYVSTTIVTHLLDGTFSLDTYAKERFKAEFLRMGLKRNEDSGRWSLSGFSRFKDIITIVDTYVLDRNNNRIRVSKNTILGDEEKVSNGLTVFRAIDNSYGAVPTEHVKYV